MTSFTKDPLLAIAKAVLWFLQGVMLLAAAACVLAIPAMFIFQEHVTIELAKEVPGFTPGALFGVATAALLLGAVLLVALFRVFQLLMRIVDTVGEGDPFVPENARRLTQMAWLTLAVQIVEMAIGAVLAWGERIAGESAQARGEIQIDGDISSDGLLLVLILFVLARVFRQGAAMREELEGTV